MKDDRSKNATPNTPVIFESPKDEFHRFAKTPHLSELDSGKKSLRSESDLLKELNNELKGVTDKEEFFDKLRRFKRKQHENIATLESEPFANRRLILKKLSDVADTIITAGFRSVEETMESEFGKPTYLSSYKQILLSELAIVSMGKHGAQEMNYESDLDLVFLFSYIGETNGRKQISNTEYFSKFTQRFINLLSLLTSAGRCYAIDLELRPSGHSGPLVSSFEHFLDHQMNHAQEWERMALLRARLVAAPAEFGVQLEKHLFELAYKRPLPDHFFPVMHEIRERVLNEKVKENANTIDLKWGPGSLMDVEFVLQGLQLKTQNVYPTLRKRGLFEVLDVLKDQNLLSSQEWDLLSQAHLLYRTLESHLHLLKKRPEHVLVFETEDAEVLCKKIGIPHPSELKSKLMEFRQGIRNIYTRIYQ